MTSGVTETSKITISCAKHARNTFITQSQMTNHDFQLQFIILEHTTYDNGVKYLFNIIHEHVQYIECVLCVRALVFIVVQLLIQYTINVFSLFYDSNELGWFVSVVDLILYTNKHTHTHHSLHPPSVSFSQNSKSKTISVWPLDRTNNTMQSVNDYYNNEYHY